MQHAWHASPHSIPSGNFWLVLGTPLCDFVEKHYKRQFHFERRDHLTRLVFLFRRTLTRTNCRDKTNLSMVKIGRGQCESKIAPAIRKALEVDGFDICLLRQVLARQMVQVPDNWTLEQGFKVSFARPDPTIFEPLCKPPEPMEYPINDTDFVWINASLRCMMNHMGFHMGNGCFEFGVVLEKVKQYLIRMQNQPQTNPLYFYMGHSVLKRALSGCNSVCACQLRSLVGRNVEVFQARLEKDHY